MKTKAEYQKEAGELVRAFHDGDPLAQGRVRTVWSHDPAVYFGLQRSQHVIAKENGAASWGALMRSLPPPPEPPKTKKVYEAPKQPCPHFEGGSDFCLLCARNEEPFVRKIGGS